MIKKALYFSNPTYLSCKDEQLVIKLPDITEANMHPKLQQKGELTRPIEDIGIVVLDHPQITITHGAMEKLMQNSSVVVFCDNRKLPLGLCLPLYAHTIHNLRLRYQVEASKPLVKQLWQQTVQYKIKNQAFVLQHFTTEKAENMYIWSNEVRSGDSTYLEARAAAFYWRYLFADLPYFVREREGPPPNQMLNYGYAILRAVMARSLVMSGLNVTIGINHHNKYNPYCLADDIMEPYRPYVDQLVLQIIEQKGLVEDLPKEYKVELLRIPVLDVVIEGRKSPLMVATRQTAASLAKCFAGKSRKIEYPCMG